MWTDNVFRGLKLVVAIEVEGDVEKVVTFCEDCHSLESDVETR